jgi:L-lactate dehydrogenase complex protein LldG
VSEKVEQGQTEAARQAIMTAIRQQLATSVPFDAVHEQNRARREVGEPQETIPLEQSASLLDGFRQSLEAVGGHCMVVTGEAQAAEAVRRIVTTTQAKCIAVSDSALVGRVLEPLEAEVELMSGKTKSELFKCDLGVTSAQWAIAETGTLVLESDLERNRLASLVPPVHIAIMEAARIRQTLGEVLGAIDEKGQNLSRTITFITGPSRTSDIELTLAIGVHGPAELYVIIIEGVKV